MLARSTGRFSLLDQISSDCFEFNKEISIFFSANVSKQRLISSSEFDENSITIKYVETGLSPNYF